MLRVLVNTLVVMSAWVMAAPTAELLPAPNLGHFIAIDPTGIIVIWEPVQSRQDPVQGYKVKLWESKGVRTYKYTTVEGKKVLAEEIKLPELSDFSSRDGKLYEYRISGAQQSQLVVNGIALDTPYMVQVQAYNALGDGQPTPQIRFLLHSE